MFRTAWLSFHARYRCHDTGVCCTSAWPIPLEQHRVAAIAAGIGERRLHVPAAWLTTVPSAPADVAGTLALDGQACVFYRRDRRDETPVGRCAIHGVLGHQALPAACQHFPRICLLDARGVSITLSHYCPTANNLLRDRRPMAIVEGPPALPDGSEPEGLDARGALPPLLTATVLMDHASYAQWERHLIRVLSLADDQASPWTIDEALARLEADAAALSRWRPGTVPLGDAIEQLNHDARVTPDAVPDHLYFNLARRAIAVGDWPGVPDGVESVWTALAPDAGIGGVLARYLASHAFASWLAYQGNGIRTGTRAVRVALAVARVEAARIAHRDRAPLSVDVVLRGIAKADLLLRHVCDREMLAEAVCSSMEWRG